MKLKGVNPLEQHVEKIVLAVVAAVFLLVVATQLLTQPNKVKIGSQPPVPPGRAFEAVRAKAEVVRQRMANPDVDLPPIASADIAEQFLGRRAAPVAPASMLTQLGRRPQIDRVAAPASATGTDRIATITIPAPTALVGYSPRGAVSPVEVQRHPAIKGFLPESQPFDKAGVSVEARLNGRGLREALTQASDGAKPIPAGWWRDNVEILTVRLEREELTSSGEWTNLTTVPQIPGRLDIMEDVRKVRTSQELAEVVADARAISEQLLQPSYLQFIAGSPWVPPTQAVRLLPQVQNPRIDRLLKDREDVRRQKKELEEQRDDLQGGPSGGSGPSAPGGRGAGRGPGGGGGGGGGGGEPPRTTDERRRLEQRIAALTVRENRINEELRRLGHIDAPAEAAPEAGASAAAAPVRRPLLENAAVTLWAHDITVQPGKMYRYRMSVGINNPVFGRGAGLVPEQQDLAANPILMSQPSVWSEPVYVLDDRYFFLTSAHEADALGGARAPARARADVYEFFYGYFRRGDTQLEPGDQVVAQVKLPPELPIFELAAAPAPGDDGEGDQQAGGRAGLQMGGEEDPAGPVMNRTLWTQPVVARMNCFLLDVASVPGSAVAGGASRTVAYFRGSEGGILSRDPKADEQEAVFRIVSQSAKEGELQGRPADPEPPAPPPVRDPAGPRRTPRNDPPPGSGGGAGGG
jgi:hypothetical protein